MNNLNFESCYTQIDSTIINALCEDIGNGDITTSSIVPEDHDSDAVIIAKEDLILAGIPFAKRAFRLVNSKLKFRVKKRDGSRVRKDSVIAEISGNTVSLLMAERVALNLLQRLSGIATLTRRFVECVEGFPAKIVDTRKTTPGLRFLEKYAVRVGGGSNHRYGLYDGVLIKDNHIVAAGGLSRAVRLARLKSHHLLRVEAEAKDIKEVKEALSAGVDAIMLDNMSVNEIKKAVNTIRGKRKDIIIEASGSITLGNVGSIAATGVDFISIGAITHSAPAVDICMKLLSSSR